MDTVAIDVLMSTYAGETAANLAGSLASLAAQCCQPRRLVLVVDGPVDAGQEAVIESFKASRGDAMAVIRRPVAGGLAAAMNDGLAACESPYVMRMDSDDLCEPDRVAIQARYLATHSEIDLVGSWSREFYEDGGRSDLKVAPCLHDDIARALRWRNVIVHPTVVARAAALRAVGGYRTRYGLLEDYDLFVRLALAGAHFHVIPKVLLRVRSSVAQKTRRGGWKYLRNEVAFRRECLRTGFVTTREFLLVTCLYAVFRLVSGPMRRRLYSLART